MTNLVDTSRRNYASTLAVLLLFLWRCSQDVDFGDVVTEPVLREAVVRMAHRPSADTVAAVIVALSEASPNPDAHAPAVGTCASEELDTTIREFFRYYLVKPDGSVKDASSITAWGSHLRYVLRLEVVRRVAAGGSTAQFNDDLRRVAYPSLVPTAFHAITAMDRLAAAFDATDTGEATVEFDDSKRGGKSGHARMALWTLQTDPRVYVDIGHLGRQIRQLQDTIASALHEITGGLRIPKLDQYKPVGREASFVGGSDVPNHGDKMLARLSTTDKGSELFMGPGQYRKAVAEELLTSSAAILDKLLTLVHLVSGMPARGTELATYTVTTGISPRTVQFGKNTVMIVQTTGKTDSWQPRTRVILRFLDVRSAELLLAYLSLVRPVEVSILKQLRPNSTQAADTAHALFIRNGRRMTDDDIRTTIASVLETCLGFSLNMSTLRHVMIAFGREHLVADRIAAFHEHLQAVDIQAGHSARTAAERYAIEPGHLVATNVQEEFFAASSGWHAALGLHSAAGSTSKRRSGNKLVRFALLHDDADRAVRSDGWCYADSTTTSTSTTAAAAAAAPVSAPSTSSTMSAAYSTTGTAALPLCPCCCVRLLRFG